MKKIDIAVEKCTENFILTLCSECPLREKKKDTKLCRDELILYLWKENKRLEKENEEYSKIVSGLTEENRKLNSWFNTACGQCDELQEQIENLKTFIDFKTANLMCDKHKQQIVKDTAKEICDLILEHWENKQFVECDWLRVAISEKYGVEVE